MQKYESFMTKQKQSDLILEEKEKATPATIGVIFDYYANKGLDKLPDGIIINANKFKSNNEPTRDKRQ